jgi:hypothetical protein
MPLISCAPMSMWVHLIKIKPFLFVAAPPSESVHPTESCSKPVPRRKKSKYPWYAVRLSNTGVLRYPAILGGSWRRGGAGTSQVVSK